MKKVLRLIVMVLLVLLPIFFLVAPGQVEKSLNPTLHPPPYEASEAAKALHEKLSVADLHADSLLWDRDLLERGSYGNVDIPRLIEGNVALQAFTVVTKTPRGMNIERTDDRTDNITALAIVQLWPVPTWGSLKERALHQARKLNEFASRSGGKFVLIKTAAELIDYLERRKNEGNITAGFLGLEGAHALEGDLDNIDVFHDAGFRMMAPTHFFDNDLAGSAHGVEKSGLTSKGKEMVKKMEAKGMIVDVAHASAKAIDDVLAIASKPVIVSHTGAKGTCNNARNLSDDQIRRISDTGGVIGIGFWDTAVCGKDAKAISHAIRYVSDLAGVEHVGLGSDYDGAVAVPFDTTGLVLITEALMAEGFTDEEIGMIMGENVLRILLKTLR